MQRKRNEWQQSPRRRRPTSYNRSRLQGAFASVREPPTATFFSSPVEFRNWLRRHHATEKELWVGFRKKHTGRPSITWPESVDEALCFGWIDGVRKSLDADAYTIRFTPRKPTSIWSAINVAKVEALRKEGKMQSAGEAAFAKRTAERTGVYSFERTTSAKLSGAESRALKANPKAAAFFSAQPPWYQRAATHWIVSAKRDDTRAKRLAALIADSAAGRTVKPLTRPAKKP